MIGLPLALLAALAAGRPAPPPMPSLAVIAGVRIAIGGDGVVITEDVTFDRGSWSSGDLDFYVAFGAPGLPRAFDARVIAVPEGAFSAPLDATGEVVVSERATHKPDGALPLLGSVHMAGEVVRAREPALRRAFAFSGRITLRVRSLVAMPVADAAGTREVLVRLGTSGSEPLALQAVEVVAADPSIRLESASASLAGEGADPHPVLVSAPPGTRREGAALSPVLITRGAGDDLSVRWIAR